MMFVGDKALNFNQKLLSDIKNINDYSLISLVNDYKIDNDKILDYSKCIILIPISENNYFNSLNIGWSAMVKSAFLNSTNIYTSIFLVEYEKIDPSIVAEIINSFDKENLIDNIWIYPDPHYIQNRSNSISNLAWQKSLAK